MRLKQSFRENFHEHFDKLNIAEQKLFKITEGPMTYAMNKQWKGTGYAQGSKLETDNPGRDIKDKRSTRCVEIIEVKNEPLSHRRWYIWKTTSEFNQYQQ